MVEFLVSQGHQWKTVTHEYPSDLLRIFYRAAQRRLDERHSVETLTLLKTIRLAYMSARPGGEQSLDEFRRMCSQLEKIVKGESQSQEETVQKLADNHARLAKK